MSADIAALKANLAEANRILAHEGVLDAFGHVSCRSPVDPDRFFLARSLAPELVTPDDILEYHASSEPIVPTPLALYSERVIHGSIYQARPDVMAICHHHAPALMPFCLTDLTLRVVTQLGACIGSSNTPLWDQRDGFGATNHLVTTTDQARSLAQCLGEHPMVLMKRHGATVVGGSLAELAFRCVYSCRDAELQLRALQYGQIDAFTNQEIQLASKFLDATLKRAWGYWQARLAASSAGKGA
jgi:ribulose-5-phosphate 4-epimerase/fuculose-1-phosphate aldolase